MQPDDFSLSINHNYHCFVARNSLSIIAWGMRSPLIFLSPPIISLFWSTKLLLLIIACDTCSMDIFLSQPIISLFCGTILFFLRHMLHGYCSLSTNHIIVQWRDTEFLLIACRTCSTIVFSLSLWRDIPAAVIVLFLLFIITGVPLFAGIIHLVMLKVFFKEWTILTHHVKHRLHTLDKLIEIPWKKKEIFLYGSIFVSKT
mgnify:CR=1 FL=1